MVNTFELRRERLQRWLQAQGYAAAFITPGAGFRYLTGWATESFERLTALILPAGGVPILIVPALDAEAARTTGVADIRPWADGTNPFALLQAALPAGVIAVEKARLPLARWESMAAAVPGIEAIDVGPVLNGLRLVKDAAEIASLQAAADLLNPALEQALATVKPGVTERQLARTLRNALEEHGAEGLAFDIIAAGGANSALPHSHPGDYALQTGDILLFDFGAVKGGYCSDTTRCFSVGPWNSRALEIYNVVLAACKAGVAAVQVGATGADVDRAARAVIEAAGYGEYFIHRTGHGIGMEAHEGPYMAADQTQRLEPGHVVTVEPGIYIPGFGGIRIEEMVAVTAAGPQVLTSFSTEPREL